MAQDPVAGPEQDTGNIPYRLIAAAMIIDKDFRIDAQCFHFHLEEAHVSSLKVRQKRGELIAYYPENMDLARPVVQEWLQHQIEESLRQHAKVLLIPRIRQMAEQRNLHPSQIHIHKSRTRWGSCSSRGSINLSLYLMLVPQHLQDYVMQHELTHLVEMNHGTRFWQLLDLAVNGQSRQLRKELRNYTTDIKLFETI